MTISELIVFGKKFLHKSDVMMILAFYLEHNSLEMLLYLDEKVKDETSLLIKDAFKRKYQGEPLAYILGNVNFYGYNFKIDKRALIPRFETEELVDYTIKLINKHFKHPVNILDIGCGSGIIGLTLKKEIPLSLVTLIDISNDALDLTKENASFLEIVANIYQSDMLNDVHEKFDVIISNPPYIKTSEEVAIDVLKYEPHNALYGGTDGLKYYIEILQNITKITNEKYLLAFEIGAYIKDDVINLIKKYLPNAEIIAKDDMSGRNRMIFVLSSCV